MMFQNNTKVILAVLTLAFLSSCNNSKSNETNYLSNNGVNNIYAQKQLASCNKSAGTDISVSLAAVTDQVGNANPNWLKMKFNFLSANATASGNVIRIFKWKVTGVQAYLDPTPLAMNSYALSNPQALNPAQQSITASEVTTSNGYYIALNDSDASFQVLKVVVYNSAGQIVSQINSLIPQFNANYSDYVYNADGTARATVLTDLHPLKAYSGQNLNSTQVASYYQAFCF